MRITILAILVASVLPGVAAAAAVQGTIPVNPNRNVSGTFTAPGTQTWKLNLERGKDYAVSGAGECPTSVVVRAAGEKTLASFMFSKDDIIDGAEGTSLRASYTGAYTVAATAIPAYFADCADAGEGYYLRAARDCAGNDTTRCGIVVGHAVHNLRINSLQDRDFFRTRLVAGRSYRATTAGAGYCVPLAVLDAAGRTLAGAFYTCQPSADTTQPVDFTASTSGIYYLATSRGDEIGIYSLSLVLAR